MRDAEQGLALIRSWEWVKQSVSAFCASIRSRPEASGASMWEGRLAVTWRGAAAHWSPEDELVPMRVSHCFHTTPQFSCRSTELLVHLSVLGTAQKTSPAFGEAEELYLVGAKELQASCCAASPRSASRPSAGIGDSCRHDYGFTSTFQSICTFPRGPLLPHNHARRGILKHTGPAELSQ